VLFRSPWILRRVFSFDITSHRITLLQLLSTALREGQLDRRSTCIATLTRCDLEILRLYKFLRLVISATRFYISWLRNWMGLDWPVIGT